MVTRAKGKQVMLSEAERQEQYNKIKQEELRCRAMRKKLQEQCQMLEKMQAPPVGVLPSGSPRGIPRRVVTSRDSPRSERDGARNTRI